MALVNSISGGVEIISKYIAEDGHRSRKVGFDLFLDFPRKTENCPSLIKE